MDQERNGRPPHRGSNPNNIRIIFERYQKLYEFVAEETDISRFFRCCKAFSVYSTDALWMDILKRDLGRKAAVVAREKKDLTNFQSHYQNVLSEMGKFLEQKVTQGIIFRKDFTVLATFNLAPTRVEIIKALESFVNPGSSTMLSFGGSRLLFLRSIREVDMLLMNVSSKELISVIPMNNSFLLGTPKFCYSREGGNQAMHDIADILIKQYGI